jgi:eukaryotic-like serine/threonine-protein kinase
MLGKTIGKYRVVEKIGRGGMGTVYKAIDETLDREVAVKVLNPDLGESALVRRFRAEAMTLARLNHPGIATIFELFRNDDDLLMVMEFVRGETFDRMVERLGPLAPEHAASLGAQVLDALGHAHRLGIVHRDLKPANLMVGEYGAVKIMDFGIARVVGTEHLTSDGLMMGTPAYMAPEQVLATDVDGRADLYSVGVVMYRLLSGSLPFSADTAIAMAHKQVKDPPTPLKQFRSELPPWCEDVLWRALAKSPADRFQTAEEFRDALLGCGASLVPMALPRSLETTLPPDQPVAVIDRPPEPAAVPQVSKDRSNGSPARSDAAAEAAFAATVPVATPAGVRVGTTPVRDQSPVLAAPHPSSVAGEPTTVILKPRHLAVAAGLFGILVLAISGLALLVVRRPGAAPAAPVTSTSPLAPAAPSSASPPSSAASSEVSAAAAESAPPARPAAARDAALPPLTVFDIRFVAAEKARVRERDAIMTFSSGVLTIAERHGAVLRSIPYEQIRSVNYSRSRQPMWKSPRGPAPVMRVGGGALGIFRSEPHWVSIRTKEAFSVLRVGPEHARSLATAFSQRTGVTMDTVPAPSR